MKCEGSSMIQLSLSVLSMLVHVVGLTTATRYGDYPVAHMPQYGAQHEDSDVVSGTDEYNDKSPDAPARLDYKYEEGSHGRSDDFFEKDDDRNWDKPHKKKRKPPVPHNDHYSDLDKDSFAEVMPEFKTNSRFVTRRLRPPNKKYVTESDKLPKYSSIVQNEDIDNEEIKNDYVHKNSDGNYNFEEFNHLNYRSTTPRKVIRKARDRSLYQSERRKDNKYSKLDEEEIDARLDREQYFRSKNSQVIDTSNRNKYFESKRTRRPDGVIDRVGMNNPNKHDYNYDEYDYDMKRVLNMKNKLPALIRTNTVQSTEAQSTLYIEQRPYRRTASLALLENLVNNPEVTTVTSVTTITTYSSTSTTTTSSTSTMGTIGTSPSGGNSSELSLAEKSRLSILKKVLKKESARNISSTKKPPVLMQVTSKMPTVVMVEPQPRPEMARRAVEVSEDSPERLKRARRLMRHKLVANARSIHDLTDNWDEMVCDYIDVALLDADAAPYIDHNSFITIFVALISLLLIYC